MANASERQKGGYHYSSQSADSSLRGASYRSMHFHGEKHFMPKIRKGQARVASNFQFSIFNLAGDINSAMGEAAAPPSAKGREAAAPPQ